MKIIFDLRSTGLGNNGGSSTLVKSGNQLKSLGHEIIFIDSMSNKHTWAPLECEHIIVNRDSQIPDADFIIATGYKSVMLTVSAPSRCGKKCHWVRAWEYWVFSEKDIIRNVLNQPIIKLVNSVCLQSKLKEYGVDSYIVRPGYDFQDYFPSHTRDLNRIVLGGLYNTKGIHEKRKRTSWVLDATRVLKKFHPDIKLWMFGIGEGPKDVDLYFKLPSISEKNYLYNQIHIWLAPTMSEGLHIPPAEAMLTECPVVGTSAEMSGMQDYLVNGVTGVVTSESIEAFIEGVDFLIKNEDVRKHYGINARNKILQLGSRIENMKKFIELLESLK